MKYLFNSQGQHIANVIGDQLYAPTGANIGHFLGNYASLSTCPGAIWARSCLRTA